MERSMGKGNLCGQMTHFLKGTFSKIIFMDLENTNGKMEEYMKDSGSIIKWKEKVLSHGQMEENM